MRRIPIRAKLAFALAVPLVAVGLVTVIEVISVANEARDVRDQSDLATATIGPNGLITALQNERNWTAAQLVGVDQRLEMDITGYDATRAETDAALTQFEREIGRRGGVATAAYAPALEGLAALDELRAEIDVAAGGPDLTFDNMPTATEMFDRYTALVEPFFGGMSRISIAMDDPELRQGAELMEVVTRQLETIPQLTNALILPANVRTGEGDEAGINSPAEIAEVARLQNAFRRQAEALRTAGGPFEELASDWYPATFTASLDEQATQALATSRINVDVLIEGLDEGQDDDLAYLGYRDEVAQALGDRANELSDGASSRQQRFAILMTATFLAAVALTVLVSLSITRPLRSLTRQAKEMAERRLPDAVTAILDIPLGDDVIVPKVTPVAVNTRDEVSDVADALNTVQDSALDLAVEQAVLRRNIADSFVNLGRRNQNLLGRQLDFITELETNETDPDALASLFRLDHLATRMRRNAESLLVLAGIEPPRQWAAPVQIKDVVRAALGEVESYDRAAIRGIEPATVVGSAAADLAHLLAELIENGLVFSPPDRPVEIRGARVPGRSDGYTIAVIDGGLGMSPGDIEAANRRLAGAESFTIAPSKYLGHYVAGNLAARHGIDVRLQDTPSAGVTAVVLVPPALLVDDAGVATATVPPPPDHRTRAMLPAVSPSIGPPGPAAPNGPAGGPGGGAPGPFGPAHGAPAAMSATANGLARRTPRGNDGAPTSPARGPAPLSDAQLASLTRAAGQDPARTGSAPAATPPASQAGAAPDPWWPGAQSPSPRPVADAPRLPSRGGADDRGPAPLSRRQPGAQMPNTAPVSLRRTPVADSPPREASREAPRPTRHPSPAGPSAGLAGPTAEAPSVAASEVYGFLSSFTAGVQRGLEASRGGQDDAPRH